MPEEFWKTGGMTTGFIEPMGNCREGWGLEASAFRLNTAGRLWGLGRRRTVFDGAESIRSYYLSYSSNLL